MCVPSSTVNDNIVGSSDGKLDACFEDNDCPIPAAVLVYGFTDPEADALVVLSIEADPPGKDLVKEVNGDGNLAQYIYKPSDNFYGFVNITYTLSDGKAGSTPLSGSLVLEVVEGKQALSTRGHWRSQVAVDGPCTATCMAIKASSLAQ